MIGRRDLYKSIARAQACSRRRNIRTEGFRPFSASRGPRWASGPSENGSGRNAGSGEGVGTSGGRVLKHQSVACLGA
eukprot:6431991-Pyramimonas_sp.AAC.1